MTEAEEQKFRRAKEVINEAGWVFDDFVNAETAKWLLQSSSTDERERIYTRVSVAAKLKGDLLNFVENTEAEIRIAARSES